MKRITQIGIFVLLVALLLAGCGDGGKATTAGSTEATTEAKATAEATTEGTTAADTEATAEATASPAGEGKTFKPLKNAKVETSLKSAEGNGTMTLYQYEGNKRMDINSDEGNVTFITNIDDKKEYMINHGEKMYMVMDLAEGAGGSSFFPADDAPFANEEELHTALKDVKDADYEGHPAYYAEEAGDSEVTKVWVSKEFGYPIRVEVWQDDKLIMESTAKITSPFVPEDNFFTPPEDYETMTP